MKLLKRYVKKVKITKITKRWDTDLPRQTTGFSGGNLPPGTKFPIIIMKIITNF